MRVEVAVNDHRASLDVALPHGRHGVLRVHPPGSLWTPRHGLPRLVEPFGRLVLVRRGLATHSVVVVEAVMTVLGGGTSHLVGALAGLENVVRVPVAGARRL